MTISQQRLIYCIEAWELLSNKRRLEVLSLPQVQSWLHSQLKQLLEKELRVSRLNES